MTLMTKFSKDEISKYLPHRPPFLFIDEVDHLVTGQDIRAIKNVRVEEEYFKGHFPSNPIMPGVLIIEALAQASCVLYAVSLPSDAIRSYYLSSSKIRFLKPVIPPCRLELHSVSTKMVSQGGVFKVKAAVSNDTVAEGEMTFACQTQK